jgi:hypothetical protein
VGPATASRSPISRPKGRPRVASIMTTGVYIAVVEIDPSCEYKIRNKHGITGDEVRQAIILTTVSAY